jgi:hypothetical protein
VATDIQTPPTALGPTVEEKRAAVEQVLQSSSFLRADQLKSFLRFVCEMEMAGRSEQISEYLIGVEAIGRPNGYSPGEDPVVRRRAVHLREKLDEIYANELRDAALRIELPKGRYVPRFVRVERPPEATPSAAMVPVAAAPIGRAGFGRRHLALAFLAGALTAAAVFFAGAHLPLSWRGPLFEGGVSYEAEAQGNVVGGMTKAVLTCASCSGGGRVRSIGVGAHNYVEFVRVEAGEGGEKELVLHYLLDGERSFFISVNGGPGFEVRLSAHNWATPSREVVKVRLHPGPNTIRFFNETSYAPDLDRIVLRD